MIETVERSESHSVACSPDELEPIEMASRDEISALQLERMKWSLRHAYDNVAHYRHAFDQAGCTPTTSRTSPTWHTFRSPPRPTSGRPTPSGCSPSRNPRSHGSTPHRAPPANPP